MGDDKGDGERPRRGRPPSGRPRLSICLTIKGLPGWKDWFDGEAKALGVTAAELIDEALECLHRGRKISKPPPRT